MNFSGSSSVHTRCSRLLDPDFTLADTAACWPDICPSKYPFCMISQSRQPPHDFTAFSFYVFIFELSGAASLGFILIRFFFRPDYPVRIAMVICITWAIMAWTFDRTMGNPTYYGTPVATACELSKRTKRGLNDTLARVLFAAEHFVSFYTAW